ncbi:MAG: DUF4097 family beta strand repeat-containing protein [Tahibacter sp.]
MKRLILLVGLLPAFAMANECKFTAQHDFDIDPASLKTLAFAMGSSDLDVEGVAGLAKIEVRGKACASDKDKLADLDVDQQRSGDRVTVTPRQTTRSSGNWFGSNYAYIDLHVRVPRGLAIDVRGGSGDAQIRDVATLNFESGSGDLNVQKIAGLLTLEVRSGDVQGSEIGTANVRSVSSGDISLREVFGDVHVGRCGSGDLQFNRIGGNVNIGSVGSGDVSATEVVHDVSVDSIGSGDVSVSGIGGNFTVRAKGSGDVNHHEVSGKVSVPRDND